MISISSANIFIGSMSAGTLTVASVQSGTLAIGQSIFGTNVPIGTTITGFVGGSGAMGTYTVSSTVTVGSTSMSASSTYGNIVVYVRGGYRYYVTTNGTVTNGGSNYTIAPTTIGVVFPSGISNDGSTILGSGTLANPAVQIVANIRLDISPELLNKRITNMGMNLNNTTASSNASTGALIVSGGAGIGGNVNVDGILDVFNTTVSTSTATGALQVIGGAGIGGNVNVGGILDVFNTTASTSQATGALQVSGGAGIGGNTYVGGSIFASGGDRYKTQLIAANSAVATRYSPDGISWIGFSGSGFPATGVNSIVWGGSTWVAGFNDGKIFTSPDGFIWTSRTSNLAVCNEVAWNGSYWLAGGSAASVPAVVRSMDGGQTWSTVIAGTGLAGAFAVQGIVWNGTAWIVGSSATSGNTIVRSSDSVTWETLATSTAVICNGKLRFNGSRYVICVSNALQTRWSLDAASWNSSAILTGILGGGVVDAAWNGSTWMLVTSATTTPGSYTSPDGGQTAWARTAGTLTPACLSIIWNPTGSIWIAGGISGTTGGIYYSSTGATWTLGSSIGTTAASPRIGFSSSVPDNSSQNTSTGALVVSGGVGIRGNVYIGGDYVRINSTVPSSSASTGALVVSGGMGVGEDLYVNADIRAGDSVTATGALYGANAVLSATTASTSSTTGALIVAGGVGIEGQLYVDDPIYRRIDSTLTWHRMPNFTLYLSWSPPSGEWAVWGISNYIEGSRLYKPPWPMKIVAATIVCDNEDSTPVTSFKVGIVRSPNFGSSYANQTSTNKMGQFDVGDITGTTNGASAAIAGLNIAMNLASGAPYGCIVEILPTSGVSNDYQIILYCAIGA
jgi:hypothetical protein